MSVSFANTASNIHLAAEASGTTYAAMLRACAVTPSPIINSGVITYPPGLTVADLAARATLIASCDAATTTITLSASDKTLALALVDAFYWGIVHQDIVAFRAALYAAA